MVRHAAPCVGQGSRCWVKPHRSLHRVESSKGDAKVNHEAALPRPSSDGDSPRGYHHQRGSRGQTSHNLTIPPTAIRGSRPGLLALTTATNTTDSPQAPEGLQELFHPDPFFPRKILSSGEARGWILICSEADFSRRAPKKINLHHITVACHGADGRGSASFS